MDALKHSKSVAPVKESITQEQTASKVVET